MVATSGNIPFKDGSGQTKSMLVLDLSGVGLGPFVPAHCMTDASGNIITPQCVQAALVDRSGAVTSGGSPQQIAPPNASRKGFLIQNNSSGDLWVNSLATAAQSQPSLKIPAGGYWETPPTMPIFGAISLIGATTSQAFTAREW